MTAKLGTLQVLRGLGLRVLFDVVAGLLGNGKRSLASDSARIVGLMAPRPRICGLSLVPRTEPFVLVANHLQLPGLWVGWVACTIADAVAKVRTPESGQLHWVVTSEWRWFEIGGRWIPHPITSVVFPRAARVWGMIATPSRPSDTGGWARALRQMLKYLDPNVSKSRQAKEPVALFPEGLATVSLANALPGIGAFLARVSDRGIPILPVGAFEEDGTLVVRFGTPFSLSPPAATKNADEWAGQQVMISIARLLPEAQRGAFAHATASSERDQRLVFRTIGNRCPTAHPTIALADYA